MKNRIKQIFNNKTVKQSFILLTSTICGMGFLLASNYFLTRLISIEDFGNYSYVLNVFNFFQVIFNFGFFYSINRQVSLSQDLDSTRRIFGAGLSFVFFLSLPMMFLVYIFSVSLVKDPQLVETFLIIIPFSVLFLMTNFNELILQGANRITILALSRVLPKFIFLIIVYVITFKELNFTRVSNFLVFYSISLFFGFTIIIALIKPIFSNFKKNVLDTWSINKSFGFNVYIGAIVSLGASSISGILIGQFGLSNIEVGYYSIALQFSAPLALIPNVIATSSFKDFSQGGSISDSLLISTIGISLFALLLIYLTSSYIIEIIYGSEYLNAITMVRITSFGAILYGISDFFNRFLLANGYGQALRNTSFVVGGVLLISNLVLIKIFGGIGASMSYVFAGLTYLSVIVYYYKRTKSELFKSGN